MIELPGLAPIGDDELLVIVGETASGKTALALSLARKYGAEIVGADSVQVYRGFDIGSGKPTRAELAGEGGGPPLRHHLIDVADPDEPFDAAQFVSLADRAIADIRGRGRIPIVCGGTYLWVRALLHGLADAPSAPPELRAKLVAEAKALGPAALHARLAEVDPPSAARLHPNDVTRVVRALEVFALTGKPLSQLQAAHGFASVRHRARLVAIANGREVSEKRIADRVASMLASGWIDEVRALLDRGYGGARAMGAVGYAQVAAFVRGELAEHELMPSIVRATRIFARRQRTWLKGADVSYLRP